MKNVSAERVRNLADYFGVTVDEHAELSEIARAFRCDEAYVTTEPALPATASNMLARLGADLTDRDREEARRFAAYLAHATDD